MMYLDQEVETALLLVKEAITTEAYLQSKSCPEHIESMLTVHQSTLLTDLKEHLEQSLEIFNSSSDNGQVIKTEDHAIKDLSKSISVVNKSIKKLNVLLTDNLLPDFDLMVQSELDSLYIVRDELMDVQAAIL